MPKVFVPLLNDHPAPVEINGHRLLIVSSEQGGLLADLEVLGAEEIREVLIPEEDSVFNDLESASGLSFFEQPETPTDKLTQSDPQLAPIQSTFLELLIQSFGISSTEIAENKLDQNHSLTARGGVVISPPGVSTKALLKSLEAELPWLH